MPASSDVSNFYTTSALTPPYLARYSLYTASTYVEGLDEDTVTGAPPTYGTLLCICEESLGGKGSDEKVAIGLVAAQPTTGEVTYDCESFQSLCDSEPPAGSDWLSP